MSRSSRWKINSVHFNLQRTLQNNLAHGTMKTFSLDAIIMELSAVSTDTQCRCNRQLPDCDVT